MTTALHNAKSVTVLTSCQGHRFYLPARCFTIDTRGYLFTKYTRYTDVVVSFSHGSEQEDIQVTGGQAYPI